MSVGTVIMSKDEWHTAFEKRLEEYSYERMASDFERSLHPPSLSESLHLLHEMEKEIIHVATEKEKLSKAHDEAFIVLSKCPSESILDYVLGKKGRSTKVCILCGLDKKGSPSIQYVCTTCHIRGIGRSYKLGNHMNTEYSPNITKNDILFITLNHDLGCFVIKCPYNPHFVKALNKYASWNDENQVWYVDISMAHELKKLGKRYFKEARFLKEKRSTDTDLSKLLHLLSPEAKQDAYRVLAKHYHPDLNKDGAEVMVLINTIFS